MTDQNNRPRWRNSQMSESTFRSIKDFGRIIAVRAGLEMTSADEGFDYLTATNSAGKTKRLPQNWSVALEFEGSWTIPGLFRLTREGKNMQENLREIDEWEAKHARVKAEYERLKAKFEGTQR